MEVTESLYSDNTEVIIEQVRETQKRGHMIEMDDFGSGYSSLGSLSSFPIDILKLDITFVRNSFIFFNVIDYIANTFLRCSIR